MRARAQALWDAIKVRYPELVSRWRMGRLAERLPDSLEIEIAPNSDFRSVESGGRSVRIDDFGKLYLNAERPLLMDELAAGMGKVLGQHEGFSGTTPFLLADNFIGRIMASTLAELPASKEWAIGQEESAALLFAALMGREEFVRAWGRDDAIALQKAYDRKFGPDAYRELIDRLEAQIRNYQEPTPMEFVLQRARKAGISGAEIRKLVNEQAGMSGCAIRPGLW